jgi:hypothetical protein
VLIKLTKKPPINNLFAAISGCGEDKNNEIFFEFWFNWD